MNYSIEIQLVAIIRMLENAICKVNFISFHLEEMSVKEGV